MGLHDLVMRYCCLFKEINRVEGEVEVEVLLKRNQTPEVGKSGLAWRSFPNASLQVFGRSISLASSTVQHVDLIATCIIFMSHPQPSTRQSSLTQPGHLDTHLAATWTMMSCWYLGHFHRPQMTVPQHREPPNGALLVDELPRRRRLTA